MKSTLLYRLSEPVLNVSQGKARLSTVANLGGVEKTLWFEVDEEHASAFACDRLDGFVVAVLLQAMKAGADIYAAGRLSSMLRHRLCNFYLPLVRKLFPNFQNINIEALELTTDCFAGDAVVTGFSGGVDSYAAINQHFDQESDAAQRITHLLFNNVGAHGDGENSGYRKLFLERLAEITPAAQELGLPLVVVDSNLPEFLPMDFIRMHHALNAAVALILQKKFRTYYYASAYSYTDCGFEKGDSIDRIGPHAFHLLSTESLGCVATGGPFTRVEKTALIANFASSRRFLNVCTDANAHGRNCSVCFKCMRTLLTLELLERDHFFAEVFDLPKYRRARKRYIAKLIIRKTSALEDEIVDLAAGRGKAWGRFAQIVRRFKFRLR